MVAVVGVWSRGCRELGVPVFLCFFPSFFPVLFFFSFFFFPGGFGVLVFRVWIFLEVFVFRKSNAELLFVFFGYSLRFHIFLVLGRENFLGRYMVWRLSLILVCLWFFDGQLPVVCIFLVYVFLICLPCFKHP